MNKQTFITQLKRALEPLKQGAQLEILADFEEHFANGQASGKTEAQVAEELGNPRELAQQYIAESEDNEKKAINAGRVGRSMFVAFGLLLLDAIIMIPLIASVFAVIVSLWAVPLSLAASSIALFLLPLLNFISFAAMVPYWLAIIVALSLLGLAVAMSVGMFYVSRYFIKFLVDFARLHKRVIVGGE